MVYDVLIADDEQPSLDTLQNLVDWDMNGFNIVATAKNGKDALKMFIKHRPHLVITDIQMPVMDGLELIRQIKNIHPKQSIIIISCHENFYYAKQAFRLNVEDYLIKDLLTREELTYLLQKVKNELNDKASEAFIPTTGLSPLRTDPVQRFNRARFYFEQLLLKSTTGISLEEDPAKYGVLLKTHSFIVVKFLIDDYNKQICEISEDQRNTDTEKIIHIINDSLDASLGGEVFYAHLGEFAAIVCIESTISEHRNICDCNRICQSIRSALYNSLSLSITSGISKPFTALPQISKYYSQAQQAASQKMFHGKGKDIFYNSQLASLSSFDIEKANKNIIKIGSLLESNNRQGLEASIKDLYSLSLNGFMQYNYVKEINSRLFSILIEFCLKHSLSYKDVFKLNYIPFEQVDALETVQEMAKWFSNVYVVLLCLVNTDSSSNTIKPYNKRVNDAMTFINNNYAQNISLEVISDSLKIHKGYLCRIFKQETGQNITDYIINTRIAEAKKLMEGTSMKLYEISEKVGFSSPQQFSLYFKRVTGKTPGKW